ncbi:MAG TPA: response regulator [Candidatus Polarisedimenticolaceae bacterium]|nr:response regulator [Candidatus Polarisedimenticolaceae bacterium]
MSRTRVLVVDDEINMRETLRDILVEEGFEVSIAETGEKAVKICKSSRFDAVLMDVRMPGIDGIEASRRIHRIAGETRVIIMSAYSVEHLIDASSADGIVGFLRKPLDAVELLRLLGDTRNGDSPELGEQR